LEGLSTKLFAAIAARNARCRSSQTVQGLFTVESATSKEEATEDLEEDK